MIKNIFYKGFNDKNIFVVRSSLTNCTSAGNVDPLYCHPSYCPSAIVPIRPTAKSDLRQLLVGWAYLP